MDKKIQCGCGKHFVNLSDCVKWGGNQWALPCAFENAKTKIHVLSRKNKAASKFIVSSELPCVFCTKPVGNNFTICMDALICVQCCRDIGGG